MDNVKLFMESMIKKKCKVDIYLLTGIRLQGFVSAFDNDCIRLRPADRDNGEQTVVMWQAVASMVESGK